MRVDPRWAFKPREGLGRSRIVVSGSQLTSEASVGAPLFRGRDAAIPGSLHLPRTDLSPFPRITEVTRTAASLSTGAGPPILIILAKTFWFAIQP
jgi:hypothetical protein